MRYDNLFNGVSIKEITRIGKEIEKIEKQLSPTPKMLEEYKSLKEQLNDVCDKQIRWILKNRKQIKRFFDYSSIQKNISNKNFFWTFNNSIFYPYYKIGNKYQPWFDELFSFISEFPSIYNNSKRIKKVNYVELLRFMDEDENEVFNNLRENQNPSWTFGSDVWENWQLNPLLDGKTYYNTYSIYETKDILFDTSYLERMKQGKNDFEEESEIILRKNAEPIISGNLFSWSFQDVKKYFPFLPDNYRLDKSKLDNGFNTMDVFFDDFSKEEIEKYGKVSINNDGTFGFLTDYPNLYFEKKVSVEQSYLDFYNNVIKDLRDTIKNLPIEESSFGNLLKSLLGMYQKRVEEKEVSKLKTQDMLERCKTKKLVYLKSTSDNKRFKDNTYPVWDLGDGKYYSGTIQLN